MALAPLRILITAVFLMATPVILSGIHSVAATETRDQFGYQHVNAAEAVQILAQNPEIIILDIRTPEEFKNGHIEGSVNINYYANNFKDLIATLDPKSQYLVHCKSGRRSGRALPTMRELDIRNVIHLDGGIDHWTASGYKIIRD